MNFRSDLTVRLFDFFATSVVLVIFCAGCSNDQTSAEVGAKNDSNIKRVANLYGGYQFRHGWQGPKDEKSLKTDHRLTNDQLQMMNIDPKNLDAIFVSERDNKPFKVRYGVGGGPMVVDSLVFEQLGINGKKLVAFNGAETEECDDARYNELLQHGGRPKAIADQPTGRPEFPGTGKASHN